MSASASKPKRHAREYGTAPRQTVITATIVSAVLLIVYIPVFAHAVDVWRSDSEFSFGFFLPPITLCLLWLRRKRLLHSLGTGEGRGMLALVAGLLLLLASARSGVHAIAGASFVLTALGAADYLYGRRTAALLFFPISFLCLGLCLYRGLLNSVGFALQRETAAASSMVASLFGVSVRRSGVDLYVGSFHFVVAEACSGMSSLLALLCLGMLMVGLTRTSWQRRALLIALILPITLAANIIRVTLVLTLSQVVGLTVVDSLVHGTLSAVLFLAAMALFLLAGKVLGCYPAFGALSS